MSFRGPVSVIATWMIPTKKQAIPNGTHANPIWGNTGSRLIKNPIVADTPTKAGTIQQKKAVRNRSRSISDTGGLS